VFSEAFVLYFTSALPSTIYVLSICTGGLSLPLFHCSNSLLFKERPELLLLILQHLPLVTHLKEQLLSNCSGRDASQQGVLLSYLLPVTLLFKSIFN
jgi:hypothetical protein